MLSHIDKYAQEAQEFFKQVAMETRNPEDLQQAFRITRAIMHTLRDRITPEESMHIISQLPMMLKGIYVDDWKINRKASKINSIPEFLEDIRNYSPQTAGKDFPDDTETLKNLFAVLRVMRIYIDEGEAEDIRAQLPESLAALFV